jgi:pimeloyl-ACP methyl ester carboxylesterase
MKSFSLVSALPIQAPINLNNRGLALVNDASGKPLTGTSFVAQIWYGASASSLTKSFAPSPFRASTTVYPGIWNPAATGGPGNIGILEGFPPGSTVTLQVAVWDSSISGLNASQALLRRPGTGLSKPFTYTIPVDPSAIPGGMENMLSFSLLPGTVLPNNPPFANPQAVNVIEDGSVSITLTGFDPEGAPLTYQIKKSPVNGNVSYNLGIATYLPQKGFEGTDSFTFIANDGVNLSQEATVSITVRPKPEFAQPLWITPNTVSTSYAGTQITLIAEVKGFSVNDVVDFSIIEDDPISDDSVVSIQGRVFEYQSKTYALASWVTQWISDGLDGNPEFYFTASGRGLTSAKSSLISIIPTDTDDTLSSANVLGNITFSTETKNVIELPDDVDLYRITASVGQTITFDVDRTSGLFTPMLRIFNSNGLEITNNVGQIAPLEISTNEAFISYNFSTSGVYYIGVSGTGNTKYDPLTGKGDLPGSYGSYRLTISSGFASHITRQDSNLEYLVDICREDNKGQPIDPTKNTWLIIHGWNSSRSEPKIKKLVDAVIATRPEDQVISLDWSSMAETGYFNIFDIIFTADVKSAVRAAAKGISPTGKWAAAILKHYGFRAEKINIIGHSFGCYVADQVADNYQPEKLRSIVALDPAANAVPEVFNPVSEVSFLANFIWSWVFHSSDLGNDFVPSFASESFVVRTGINLISAHSVVVDFFSDVLLRTSSYVASLFNLNRLTSAYFGPWVLNQFYSPFFSDKKYLAYEAIIGAPNGIADSIEYRINAPVIFIDYPSDNGVVRDRHIIAQGRVSDIDRGNSGISSVIVNGAIATGGKSSDSQTAFWSNSVTLKLGTNTIQVIATDGSTINPGKATNSVVVTYQPESIELSPQVVDEVSLVALNLAADDKTLSDRALTHALKSGPPGLSVSASGQLNWVPTESQGPSTNLVEVSVTDGFIGTTKRLVVVVREVNAPPSLGLLPDVTIAPEIAWSVSAVGTDGDLPKQSLVYALKVSPVGMTIAPNSGEIRWTPTRAQGARMHPVTVTVSDSAGSLVEQSFRVMVSGIAQPPTLVISSANPDGSISIQIRADQGSLVDLEKTGDLNTWVLAQSVKGQGIDNPVQLVLPTDPQTQALFLRLRVR